MGGTWRDVDGNEPRTTHRGRWADSSPTTTGGTSWPRTFAEGAEAACLAGSTPAGCTPQPRSSLLPARLRRRERWRLRHARGDVRTKGVQNATMGHAEPDSDEMGYDMDNDGDGLNRRKRRIERGMSAPGPQESQSYSSVGGASI